MRLSMCVYANSIMLLCLHMSSDITVQAPTLVDSGASYLRDVHRRNRRTRSLVRLRIRCTYARRSRTACRSIEFLLVLAFVCRNCALIEACPELASLFCAAATDV